MTRVVVGVLGTIGAGWLVLVLLAEMGGVVLVLVATCLLLRRLGDGRG